MRPLIGITSYVEDAHWGHWDVPAALIPITYVRAIEDAGGRALIVPPSEDAVDVTLDALDGIIFSGGADLDPSLYDADPHPETVDVRPGRDRSEAALMSGAFERNMPMLAICRGMQLLNVVKGGNLDQHLPDRRLPDGHKHSPGRFARHTVEVEPGSRLHRLVGDRPVVTSHHHQAPNRTGEGLKVVARAPDDTIEGIEDEQARFCLGVLWHPEEGEDRALFEALVHEATIYAKERR